MDDVDENSLDNLIYVYKMRRRRVAKNKLDEIYVKLRIQKDFKSRDDDDSDEDDDDDSLDSS